MDDTKRSPWNSLEIIKVIVSLFTPLTVAFVGLIVQQQLANQNSITQRQLADQNRFWQQQQKIVERRLLVYDTISAQLNRIYCFVEDVGTWKDDTPDSIIQYKRYVDGIMHQQRALWATDTFQAYLTYMDTAFSTYQGPGTDAKINASDRQKRHAVPGWNPEWSARLTEKHPDHKVRHSKLIDLMSRDLRLDEKPVPDGTVTKPR